MASTNVGELIRDGAQNVLPLDRTNLGIAPTITTAATLPEGAAGMAYSRQLVATGDGPMQWSYTGSLPPGLAISSTGLVSGTATSPFLASISVTASNARGSDTKALSLLVPNSGSGGDAPKVTTVLLLPATVSVTPGSTFDLQATVEDQSGDPIRNIVGVVSSTNAAVADGVQIAVTDASGEAVIRVTGAAGGTTSVGVTFDNVPSPLSSVTTSAVALTKKLLVAGLDSDSFGDVGVSGVVFAMPATGRLIGAPIGEFSGKTIDGTGSLKVPASEFNGGSLAVGTKVKVYMETADEFSPLFEAEIIEE